MDPTCYVCSNPEATPGPDGVPRCGGCAKAETGGQYQPSETFGRFLAERQTFSNSTFGRDNSRTSDPVAQGIDDDWEKGLQDAANDVWRGMCRK